MDSNAAIHDMVLSALEGIRAEIRSNGVETRANIESVRVQVNELAASTIRQLSEHETKILDVCGNGQPGRLAKMEKRVGELGGKLTAYRYWFLGVAAAFGAIVGVIEWAFPRH